MTRKSSVHSHGVCMCVCVAFFDFWFAVFDFSVDYKAFSLLLSWQLFFIFT